MAHVPDGNIKTNMFLIWAGPDGKDIYDNFKLPPNHQYDVDYVLDKFEKFCQPLCNFCAARLKFRSVSQHAGETIDTFYHRILCTRYVINVNFPTQRKILLMPSYMVPITTKPRKNYFKCLSHSLSSKLSLYADILKVCSCTLNKSDPPRV